MKHYRPEIDGLRAIAVVAVILYHAQFATLSGGYVGVDIFFVISGYLITGIIFEELRAGRFSLVRFYERRVRRILPALFLVSAACVVPAWFWMLPAEFKDFCQSLVAVNLFASNILFFREVGYFQPVAELKPLIHTWSLAVEEQYYLLFPLFMILMKGTHRGVLLALLSLICLASFLLLVQWAREAPDAAFYLLPARAWELGVGALLALALPSRHYGSTLARDIGAVAGMAMVAYSMLRFDDTTLFPSHWTLVPILGTAMIIALATDKTWTGRALGSSPLVAIGLISYSAYLWHQPLFSFARLRSLDGVSGDEYLILSGFALTLAYFSWRFVERPFRRRTFLSVRQVFQGAVLGSALLIGIGLSGHLADGLPGRLDDRALHYLTWAGSTSPFRNECHSIANPPFDACLYDDLGDEHLAVWGDSHGVELAWRMGAADELVPLPVSQFTVTTCPPAVGLNVGFRNDRCSRKSREIFNHIVSADEIKIVVLIARWTIYVEGTGFDNGEGGHEYIGSPYAVPEGSGPDFLRMPERKDVVGMYYRRTVDALLDAGKRVVLIYPIPEVGWNVPKRLAREVIFDVEKDGPLSTSFVTFKRRSKPTHDQLDILRDRPDLIRIRPERLFCNTSLPHRCVAQEARIPLYFDGDHLNQAGATMLTEHIVARMKERGWLRDARAVP